MGQIAVQGRRHGAVRALLGATVPCKGPYMEDIQGFYGRLPDGAAVVEMAAAAGLPLAGDRLHAEQTSTYGVGQLILSALDGGAKKLIVGLGGSATNDGGAGMLSALGVRFLRQDGAAYLPVGGTLDQLDRIDLSGLARWATPMTTLPRILWLSIRPSPVITRSAPSSRRSNPAVSSTVSIPICIAPPPACPAPAFQCGTHRAPAIVNDVSRDFVPVLVGYAKVKADRTSLEQRLSQLDRPDFSPEKQAGLAKKLVERFLETASTNRELLVSLIERVELTADKQIIIKFCFKQPETD